MEDRKMAELQERKSSRTWWLVETGEGGGEGQWQRRGREEREGTKG